MRCPSCRGALPGGCSTCRPLCGVETCKLKGHQPTYTVGRVTIERGTTAHTCPQWPSDTAWKREQFGDGAIQ